MKIRNIFSKPGGTLPTAAISALCVAFILLAPAMTASGETKGKVPAGRRTVVTAAGATFPLPFYSEAFNRYGEKNDIPVTYAGIGTDRGIKSFRSHQIDFAGVDVPLTAAELKEMPAQTVLVPTSLGAVEIAYHLDGVDNLRLTGELVADIYLGRVTKWNDVRIASVNPGVSLPDKEIYPVFRLDGSGTTYVFTHYLSSVSPAWAESVGTGKSLLTFPRGVAATGTPGVAGLVEKIPGAIGYVASGYSASFDIQRALLRNAAGNYVHPSTESITAAAALQTADTNVMLADSPAAEAYPISCFSWVMLYRDQSYSGRTREQAEQTLAVLRWLVGPEAQNLAAREHYAPLPTAVAARAVELLDSVTYDGKPLK